MMRNNGYVLVVLTVALASGGCATKRYGRVQSLTTAERQFYSCPAIEVEIAKVEAFRLQIAQGAQFNGASVMGFLGDWGIGNASEKNAAERTATERMTNLLALRAEKGCGAAIRTDQDGNMRPAPVPEPTPSAAAPSAPPLKFGNRRIKCVSC